MPDKKKPKEKKPREPGTGKGGVVPPEHSRFKPGKSGNPTGRPVTSAAEKKLKNLTKAELVTVGNLVVKGDVEELKRLAKDPRAPVLTVMLASVCAKVIGKGDMHALDILLNRLVGKVKDESRFEHAGSVTANVDAKVVVMLPSNGREAS